MPSPRKLRHRPSDELIDIRESPILESDRGLPWLISVFLVLFFMLSLLLVFFIITTRDIYLIQSGKVSESSGETSEELENVHVDVVPIVNRKTGALDLQLTSTTEPTIRLVLAEEVQNFESDKYETVNSEAPTSQPTKAEGYWKYPDQQTTPRANIQSIRKSESFEESRSEDVIRVVNGDVTANKPLDLSSDLENVAPNITTVDSVSNPEVIENQENAELLSPSTSDSENLQTTQPDQNSAAITPSGDSKRPHEAENDSKNVKIHSSSNNQHSMTTQKLFMNESYVDIPISSDAENFQSSTSIKPPLDSSISQSSNSEGSFESSNDRPMVKPRRFENSHPTSNAEEISTPPEQNASISDLKKIEPENRSRNLKTSETTIPSDSGVLHPSHIHRMNAFVTSAPQLPQHHTSTNFEYSDPHKSTDSNGDSRKLEVTSSDPDTSDIRKISYLDPHQSYKSGQELEASQSFHPTPVPTLTSTLKIDAKLEKRIKWKREPRTRAEKFQKFAISTHHKDCSEIGRQIHELGGNAIDAAISAEFCISAIHPHSSGPGFGNIMVVHSRKRNGTFIIDGRERAPRFANQDTFVINPSIAHIGYSSMGVPGWISTLWIAFKQFGSGRIDWKHIIEPTINLMLRGLTMDRLLATAFESRKNHVLHEKSFGSLFTKDSKEGASLDNFEYLDFLQELSNSTQSEHDFYRGKIAKSLADEMKSRGGLITKNDLESFTSIVTRAEIIPVNERGYSLAGPHLPYYFPILAKIFAEIKEKFSSTESADEYLEFFDVLIPLMQNANSMKQFVGDDHFEPEVKSKVDSWSKPPTFKSEEHVDQTDYKKKIPSFSRIVALDNDGNAVNYMSINSVPFGSVRRSPNFGFVWNNAMSSFDVFCKHEINCVKGGQRPAVRQSFPSILLDSQKKVAGLLSPTFSGLQTTASAIIQTTILNLTLADSFNTPRIYSSTDEIKVETGIPDELFRHLWATKHAKFTHPMNPLTIISSDFSLYCDHRDSYRIQTCNPAGI